VRAVCVRAEGRKLCPLSRYPTENRWEGRWMALGDSRMRVFPRGNLVTAGRERQSGVNPSPSARIHCDRMTHTI
jgi:hypothetical protein